MNASITTLLGRKIIGQHGRDIGSVADITADVETWQLQTLKIELNYATLDELKLKRPWFGTQVVHVPVEQISGASDNFVLRRPLEEMEFTGGEPIEEKSSAMEKTNANIQ